MHASFVTSSRTLHLCALLALTELDKCISAALCACVTLSRLSFALSGFPSSIRFESSCHLREDSVSPPPHGTCTLIAYAKYSCEVFWCLFWMISCCLLICAHCNLFALGCQFAAANRTGNIEALEYRTRPRPIKFSANCFDERESQSISKLSWYS